MDFIFIIILLVVCVAGSSKGACSGLTIKNKPQSKRPAAPRGHHEN